MGKKNDAVPALTHRLLTIALFDAEREPLYEADGTPAMQGDSKLGWWPVFGAQSVELTPAEAQAVLVFRMGETSRANENMGRAIVALRGGAPGAEAKEVARALKRTKTEDERRLRQGTPEGLALRAFKDRQDAEGLCRLGIGESLARGGVLPPGIAWSPDLPLRIERSIPDRRPAPEPAPIADALDLEPSIEPDPPEPLPLAPADSEYRPAARPSEREEAEARMIVERDQSLIDRSLSAHADVQDAIAATLRERGLEPCSPTVDEPDYDVGWLADDVFNVVEVKSLTQANETGQLRLGLGQVLHYRAALEARRPERPVRAVLAIEREPSDPIWASACAAAEVALVWAPDFHGLIE